MNFNLRMDGELTIFRAMALKPVHMDPDPLMHLVHNSMDHGIESADIRQQRGKPVQGSLKRDKILAEAIERGLLETGHHLSDAKVYALIFEPGFSTAEKVSNLSGRGVGLGKSVYENIVMA